MSSSTGSSAQGESAFQEHEGCQVGEQSMWMLLLGAGWLYVCPSVPRRMGRGLGGLQREDADWSSRRHGTEWTQEAQYDCQAAFKTHSRSNYFRRETNNTESVTKNSSARGLQAHSRLQRLRALGLGALSATSWPLGSGAVATCLPGASLKNILFCSRPDE